MSRRRAAVVVPAVAAVLALLPAGPARPAEPDDARSQLRAVEQDLEAGRQRQQELAQERERIAREARDLQRQLVDAASEVQQAEARATEGEERLAELRVQEYALGARLEERQGELTAALSALVRLRRQPEIVVLANTGPRIEALRAARLLASTSRTLDGEARELGRALDKLTTLRTGIATEQRALDANAERLEAGQRHLGTLLAEKQARQSQLQAEDAAQRQRLEVLTSRAKDLKSLLQQLEAAVEQERAEAAAKAARTVEPERGLTRLAPTAPDSVPLRREFASARGQLNLPVAGRVVRSFGQESDSGTHERGMTLLARDEAQVVAPYDGEIVFAGPFRGYGVVLIIAHGEGYHTLLAGLARTYVATGQEVLAGEPIGQMGRGNGENRSLYVELRRQGEAFDSRSWWADNRGKVSG